MGTSTSGHGPGDKTPLLPSWAFPSEDTVEDSGLGEDGAEGEAPRDSEDSAPSDPEEPSQSAAGPETSPPQLWRTARQRLGRVVSGGGRGSTRDRVRSAGSAYVAARGGAARAASSSVSSRAATARLGSFLANVASRGVGAAMQALGLARFVGQDAHAAFAAILDSLAPEGAEPEEVAAREAIGDALADLFEEFIGADGDLGALGSMSVDDIRRALKDSVIASIFHRWLGDLEKTLEEKAISATEAVRLERDVKDYIKATVQLDFDNADPLRIDWAGASGDAFVTRIYEEAYGFLARGEE